MTDEVYPNNIVNALNRIISNNKGINEIKNGLIDHIAKGWGTARGSVNLSIIEGLLLSTAGYPVSLSEYSAYLSKVMTMSFPLTLNNEVRKLWRETS